MKKWLTMILCISAFVSYAQAALASESQGTISSGSSLTVICQNSDCSSFGNVNWKPTINSDTTGATPVSITDSGVSGYIWGDQIGWIDLEPTNSGVVIDPKTGALSGYAYSSVGSWINFSPTTISNGTPVGVSIDSRGQFAGWAWVSGMYGGWMKFDCSTPSTCIKTDWRPVPDRSASSSNPTPPSPQIVPPVSTQGGSSASFSGGMSYGGGNVPMPTIAQSTDISEISLNPDQSQSDSQPQSPASSGVGVVGMRGVIRVSSSTVLGVGSGLPGNHPTANLPDPSGYFIRAVAGSFAGKVAISAALAVLVLTLIKVLTAAF